MPSYSAHSLPHQQVAAPYPFRTLLWSVGRMAVKASRLIDNIERTLLHLLIDPANIVPDNSQTEELHASKKEHGHHD
jgi:hypothetical protein